MQQIPSDADYRRRLTQGFLTEAEQDMRLERWRSCVDNSQLAVENAAKAGLALLGPTGRTHNPGALLRKAVDDGRFSEAAQPLVEELAENAELLGPDIHIRSDYGSEAQRLTPWELFGESDAKQSIEIARRALVLLDQLVTVFAAQDQPDANSDSG